MNHTPVGPEPIVVRIIDPDLADLIPQYLENRRQELPALQTSLRQGDFETIRRLAHSLKGSGGGYGFEELTRIGAAMEPAASSQEAASIERLFGELSDYLARVQVVYE